MHVFISQASLKQLGKLSEDCVAGATPRAVYLGCFGL